MLPVGLAFAAAKTAETSYAIYLWYAGGTVVAGGTAYVGVQTAKDYFYPNPVPTPENAPPEGMAVVIPETVPVHQEELRENAGLVHLNIVEANEIIAARRIAQQGAIEDGIQSFIQSANHCLGATTQLNDVVQRLQNEWTDIHLGTEITQSETNHIFHALTAILDELHQSQTRLAAQERQFQQPIHALTLNSAQLTAQLIQANQEIQRLQSLHQRAYGIMHDIKITRLENQVHQLSMANASLSASLRLAMQHRKPRGEPTLAHCPDSVTVEHRQPFFCR